MAESAPPASETAGTNQLWRFLFDGLPVRGALVRIDAQWRDLLAHRPYPDNVRQLLGEAMAATPLLASNLKFAGKLTLQAEGEGPVKLLLVHITHDFEMRGTARHEGEAAGEGLALLGGGKLGMIFEPAQQGSRYHAMVPLVGQNLEESLTHYFRQSEQLPTWLRLHASESGLAGLMLQRLPANRGVTEEIEEDWHRLCLLADTLQTDELMGLDEEQLLQRLFHEDTLQLFEPQPVVLRCRCSHGRISEMLLNLGREEVESIVAEQGQVEIECGFCGKQYRYDAAEIAQLFAASDLAPASELRH